VEGPGILFLKKTQGLGSTGFGAIADEGRSGNIEHCKQAGEKTENVFPAGLIRAINRLEKGECPPLWTKKINIRVVPM